VLYHAQDADALIMAAAVADFRPSTVAEQKIKKQDNSDAGITIELARNPDILIAVREQREELNAPRVVVGFAAESEDLITHGLAKLDRKGLDLLVANDITARDAGFEVDDNRVVILDRDGGRQMLELMSKSLVAEVIIRRTAELLHNQ
jgi:phosphopantothenoylcysteine decarboxylase / phosphopantothenate---cysteine ligase